MSFENRIEKKNSRRPAGRASAAIALTGALVAGSAGSASAHENHASRYHAPETGVLVPRSRHAEWVIEPAQTYVDYRNARAGIGPLISKGEFIVDCAVKGPAGVTQSNRPTWWYHVIQGWKIQPRRVVGGYYVPAMDERSNIDRGPRADWPVVDYRVPTCPSHAPESTTTTTSATTTTTEPATTTTVAQPAYTMQETQLSPETFSNYIDVSGPGPRLPANTWFKIKCFEVGPDVATSAATDPQYPGKDTWYRLYSDSQDSQYSAHPYVASNTFMNGGPSSTLAVNTNVPMCPDSYYHS